jgi:hypothetical protein
MLPLAAIDYFLPVRAQQPDQGPPSAVTSAIGHIGLTLIALVYILLSVWQG